VTGAPILYRGMDQVVLDAAYNNSAAVANSAGSVAAWREQSGEVRARADARLDIPYRDGARTKLDYFASGRTKAPLFVFIHGGYWQRNDKDGFAVFALGPLAHGVDVVTVGYTLAPQASLTQIVEEISASIDFLASRAEAFGFDAERIFVGGWSAGGHLAAMMLGHRHVRGGLAISGIFDLEPIALSFLNEPLSLTAKEVSELSPMRLLRPGLAPVRIVAGGNELGELQRQSRDYATAANAAGMTASLRMADGHDHFSILGELSDPAGSLTGDLLKLTGSN